MQVSNSLRSLVKAPITTTSVIKANLYENQSKMYQIQWWRRKGQLMEQVKQRGNIMQYHCSPMDQSATIELIIQYRNGQKRPLRIVQGPVQLDKLHQGLQKINKNILKGVASLHINNARQIQRQVFFVIESCKRIILKGEREYNVTFQDLLLLQISQSGNKFVVFQTMTQLNFHNKVFQNGQRAKSYGSSFYRGEPSSTTPILIAFQNQLDWLSLLYQIKLIKQRHLVYGSKQMLYFEQHQQNTKEFRQTRQTEYAPLLKSMKKKNIVLQKQQQDLVYRLTKSNCKTNKVSIHTDEIQKCEQFTGAIKRSLFVQKVNNCAQGFHLLQDSNNTKQQTKSMKSINVILGSDSFYVDQFQIALFSQNQANPQILDLKNEFQQYENQINKQNQTKLQKDVNQRSQQRMRKQKQVSDLKKTLKQVSEQVRKNQIQNNLLQKQIRKLQKTKLTKQQRNISTLKNSLANGYKYQYQLKVQIQKINRFKRATKSLINFRQGFIGKSLCMNPQKASEKYEQTLNIKKKQQNRISKSQVNAYSKKQRKQSIPSFLLTKKLQTSTKISNKAPCMKFKKQTQGKFVKKQRHISKKNIQTPKEYIHIYSARFKPGTPQPIRQELPANFNIQKPLKNNASNKCLESKQSKKFGIIPNFLFDKNLNFYPWNFVEFQQINNYQKSLGSFVSDTQFMSSRPYSDHKKSTKHNQQK